MTPGQLALVQSSFAALVPEGQAFAEGFYERLFSRDPGLRTLFGADLVDQRARFVAQLGEIVGWLADLDEFLERTRALGARHASYGARFVDYAAFGSALVDSLADVLGERFDGATREAWSLAYNLVAETMLEGNRGRVAVTALPETGPGPHRRAAVTRARPR